METDLQVPVERTKYVYTNTANNQNQEKTHDKVTNQWIHWYTGTPR